MNTRAPMQSAFRLATLVACVVHGASYAEPATGPLLETDVLPILTRNCMGCHGGLKKKGELDLRTIDAMLKGGETGPAVVAGQPEKSELWLLIEKDKMPKGETKLSAQDKEAIRAWIAAGMPTVSQRERAEAKPLLTPGKKHGVDEVAGAIDKHIIAKLGAAKMTPAPVCDDDVFLRRIYLDLTGRVPTPAQAKAFLDDAASDKRSKLIDALLATPEFGQQFGRTWRDWICPPELPSDMNGGKQPHKEAQDLGEWLGKRFAAGDAWDMIVRDLLLVKGEINKNPQAIFYGLIGQDAKVTPEGSARSVASLMMGVQLQCAQCHDDPYRDWSQQEFWSVAAFFGGTSGDFKKVEEKSADRDITIPKSAFLNAGTKVPAAFLRSSNEQPNRVKDVGRAVFVDWLTEKDNPYFARAFANRLWFYFFSRGIVHPIDDIRELNPPSYPALLTLLTSEFRDSNYDIKHLIRCICNSQAYQRSSIAPPGADEASQLLAERFGRSPLRVMSADMLLESLKLAYGDPRLDLRGIDPKDGNANGESAPVGDPYVEFQRDFCIDEEDPTDFTHGIPQMLTFLNHPRLLKGGKSLEDLLKANPSMKPAQVIEWLYLATLSRRPTNEEAAEAEAYVSKGTVPAAYNDLLWMLVNRSEFILVR